MPTPIQCIHSVENCKKQCYYKFVSCLYRFVLISPYSPVSILYVSIYMYAWICFRCPNPALDRGLPYSCLYSDARYFPVSENIVCIVTCFGDCRCTDKASRFSSMSDKLHDGDYFERSAMTEILSFFAWGAV